MIKMIKGTYGLKVKGVVEAMTSRSAPFSIASSREKELVETGVAIYVKEDTNAKNVQSKKEINEKIEISNDDASVESSIGSEKTKE